MKRSAFAWPEQWEFSPRPHVRLRSRRDPRRSLRDSKGNEVIFHDDTEVGLDSESDGVWACEVPSLGVRAMGTSAELAIAAAADAIRNETDRLLHTMSHTLDLEQLERKGLLLGAVDVVASGIAKPIGEFTWITGRIEIDEQGAPWFREARTDGAVFSMDPSVAVPQDGYLRMAKLRMDEFGEPTGSVLELDEPLDDNPDATWDELRRLASRDD